MSIEKVYYDYIKIQDWVNSISFQMFKDNWRPDYIVGLTRGGLIPAVMMSHTLDIPMHTLEVKLRDHANTESNLWMAEDAIGVVPSDKSAQYGGYKHVEKLKKKILIVDDINDSGATLDWIEQDWVDSIASADWSNIWNNNVRVAVLINNVPSKFKRIDYSAFEINKIEEPSWIVFPWEDWWKK